MTAHQPSWTPVQQARLNALLNAQAADPATTWIGYYCSDQRGSPANGGLVITTHREPGLVEAVEGPLEICRHGLHATSQPHRWRGSRVWIVALLGPRQERGAFVAALVRETIGEVLPGDVIDPSIAARLSLGAHLAGANLAGAYLVGAGFDGACFAGANLTGADIAGAYLFGANFRGADLAGANLRVAYLAGVSLAFADLAGADLAGANLEGANLEGANLAGADLAGARFAGANLEGANLRGAKLAGARFAGARVGLRPAWLPDDWIVRYGVVVGGPA